MKNIEQAKKYAWEQSDWIDHRNGYFSMKERALFEKVTSPMLKQKILQKLAPLNL